MNTLPAPYSHGYLYGSASVAFVGKPPYSRAVKEAARAGTLKPNDYMTLNPTYGWAAGGAISNTNDMATWIQALVSGHVFNAKYQQLWLDSLRPEDPQKPDGQEYGYGIIKVESDRMPFTIMAARRRVTIPLSAMIRSTR